MTAVEKALRHIEALINARSLKAAHERRRQDEGDRAAGGGSTVRGYVIRELSDAEARAAGILPDGELLVDWQEAEE